MFEAFTMTPQHDIWIRCGEDYTHLSFKAKLLLVTPIYLRSIRILWQQYSVVMESRFL